MQLVYLEHSIVTHEPAWPRVEHLLMSGHYQMVLSVWNLVEIAFHQDEAVKAQRIAFIERCKPQWMYDHIHIRRKEVRQFLWKRRYGIATEEFAPMTPSLVGMNSVYMGSRSPLTLTVTELIRGIDTNLLAAPKLSSKMALTFLQSVDKADWKAKQEEIFRQVMLDIVPLMDPEGKALSKVEITELVDFCWRERDAFYASCPTIAVDDAMCEVRISTPGRNPSRSDGIDLAHAVVALPYSDVFVVRDRYLRACANHARSRLPAMKLAKIVAGPDEVN